MARTPDTAYARRQAERQLEWAETYLNAAELVEHLDGRVAAEVRRLRLEVRRLTESLHRPQAL